MNGMIHKAFSLAAAMLLLAGCAGAGETAGQNSGSQSSAPLETKPVTGTVVSTQTENEGGSLTITLSDGSQQTFDYTSESRFDRQPDQLQPGDQVELEVSGEPPMVVTSTLVEEAQLETGTSQAPLYVADAALYRGTVTEVSLKDGTGTFTLAQAAGTDYGAAEMTFTVDENTRFSYPLEKLTEGAYVEVFYGGEESPAGAIASNYLGEEEMIVYNGVLLGVQEDENGGKSLVMASLDSEPFCGNSTLEELYPLAEIVFHCGDDTQFYLSQDQLVLGAKLNILHTGATTRSLPPQGNALEVRMYKEIAYTPLADSGDNVPVEG